MSYFKRLGFLFSFFGKRNTFSGLLFFLICSRVSYSMKPSISCMLYSCFSSLYVFLVGRSNCGESYLKQWSAPWCPRVWCICFFVFVGMYS